MSAIIYSKGTYQAVIEGQSLEQAATGSHQFALQLKIQARFNDQGELQPCPQNSRTCRHSLANEIGAKILLADLKLLGVDLRDFAQLHPSADNYVSLVGRKIDVECYYEVFDGRETERWQVQRHKPLTLIAAQSLQSRFGHLISGGNTPPAQTPASGENVEGSAA